LYSFYAEERKKATDKERHECINRTSAERRHGRRD
jgi:hypothetical protein